MLGVVTAPAKGGVEVLHVLEQSPASELGLEAGDLLTKVGAVRLTEITDVDDALKDVAPGAEVEITWRRDGKSRKESATVIARSSHAGEFLQRQERGTTGIAAPPWYAYAWANAKKGKEPTRETTEGKVVVILAFQGW